MQSLSMCSDMLTDMEMHPCLVEEEGRLQKILYDPSVHF